MNTLTKNFVLPMFIALGTIAFCGKSEAAVTFYTSEAAFLAATTTAGPTTFEGIAAAGGTAPQGATYTDSQSIDYTDTTLIIKSATLADLGGPHVSDVLATFGSASTLTIDFTSAGSGFTAAGGQFGDLADGGPTTFSAPMVLKPALLLLYGNGNSLVPLDSQAVLVGNFSVAGVVGTTFFGWTTSSGDTIDRIVFSLVEDTFEAVDNIRLGTFNVTPPEVPEPTSLALFGLTAIGMGIGLRQRKRSAGVERTHS